VPPTGTCGSDFFCNQLHHLGVHVWVHLELPAGLIGSLVNEADVQPCPWFDQACSPITIRTLNSEFLNLWPRLKLWELFPETR
jgi:hypothetical protein